MIYVRTSFYTWKKDRVVDFLKWNPVLHNQISTLVFQSERFCRCTLFTRTWWRNHFQNHICSLVQVHLAFAAYFAQWGCVWWIFADRMGVPTPSFVNAGDGLFTHPIGEFVTRHSWTTLLWEIPKNILVFFFWDQRRSTNFEPIQRYPKYHHLSRWSRINQSSEVLEMCKSEVDIFSLLEHNQWDRSARSPILDLMQIPNSVHHGHDFHAIFNCRDDISPIQKGSPPLVIGTLVKWSSLCCPWQAWSQIVSDVWFWVWFWYETLGFLILRSWKSWNIKILS